MPVNWSLLFINTRGKIIIKFCWSEEITEMDFKIYVILHLIDKEIRHTVTISLEVIQKSNNNDAGRPKTI